MAWTTPKTWVASEFVDQDDLNVALRDNMRALKAPPGTGYIANDGVDYSTSSSSFVEVDPTLFQFSRSIQTTGAPICICFWGSISLSAVGAKVYFDVIKGLTQMGGDDGLVMYQAPAAGRVQNIGLMIWDETPNTPFQTYRLRYKATGGTATLYGRAGTTNYNVPAQFWFRELS